MNYVKNEQFQLMLMYLALVGKGDYYRWAFKHNSNTMVYFGSLIGKPASLSA